MKRNAIIILALLLAAACTREQAHQAKVNVQKKAEKVADAFDVSSPLGKPDDAQQRERERFDAQWRQLQSFRAAQQAAAQKAAAPPPPPAPAPPQPPLNIQFVSGQKESFKNLDAGMINNAPVSVPIKDDVRGPSVLKTQVYLDRLHFSVGAIDGRWGRNSAITVWFWQRMHGMPATGDVDEATFRSIAEAARAPQAVVPYTITADDVKGPFVHIPDDVYDRQHLDCLCYESVREELGERFHVDQDFLETLNPHVKFSQLQPGATINVPNVREAATSDQHDVAKIVISIAGNTLSGFDANGALVFHAPTTVGAGYDPSPDETLKIVKIVDHPHFHYDPTLYHEVPDSMPDAHLAPGPNSPVGVVWMALSKEHYGIHGTNEPESIGYASSHGCIRLTNWDAQELQHRAAEGVPVSFVDTRSKDIPKELRK
jgi:lipoprotein-anchoring transpeptidase ErfK/SrfK